MSLFCYGILHGVESKERQIECAAELRKNAELNNIGIQLDNFYKQPIIAEYYGENPVFIWNFSDDSSTINCENLLCPDWCNYDPFRPSLELRLSKIKNVLSCVSSFGLLELWIGTSGDELWDIETIRCNLQSFVSTVNNAFQKGIDTPSIRVSITRVDKQNE